MLIRLIIFLVIFLILTGLGANYSGDGVYTINASAKAGKVVEYVRQLSDIMQTYRALDDSNQTVSERIDTGLAATADSGTANDGQVSYNDVVTELKAKKLLQGSTLLQHGGLAVGSDSAGNGVYLMDVSAELSDSICREINKQLGVGSEATGYSLTGDTSGLANTDTEASDVVTGADVDLLSALHSVANGVVEGACIEDSTSTAPNAMIYYVQSF